jgi:hypothetical protein
MLSLIMLSVVMLNDVKLSVVASLKCFVGHKYEAPRHSA